MFVVGTTSVGVNVYKLSTPWDISTAAFVNVLNTSGQDDLMQGIYIKPDGTKMYLIGNTSDVVYQYTVPSIDIQLTGPTSVAALDVQQDLNVYGKTTVGSLTATSGLFTAGLNASGILTATSGTFPSGIYDTSLRNHTETLVSIGTVTATNTISLTSGNVQTCTLTASSGTTFTMPTAVAGKSFLLFVNQAAGGGGTASFSGVKFPGGSAPTISTTASRTDLLSFVSDGTSWYGSYVQNYS